MLVLNRWGAPIGLADDEDAELIESRTWRRQVDGDRHYIVTGHRAVWLHRLLLSPPRGVLVDHINGDGTDNRRANLRLATPSQNCANRRKRTGCLSAYKGVSWDKAQRRWQAQIYYDGKNYALGRYDDEVAAAAAYDVAARERWGEYAHLNFPRV